MSATNQDEVVARLMAFDILASVPREEVAWMVARGSVRTFAVGDKARFAGEEIDEMWVILSGCLAFTLPRGGAPRTLGESTAGAVLGVMPFSRMRAAPGDLTAREVSTVFELSREHFPGLLRDCPGLTAALVHHMVDRAREYQQLRMHDDRSESLGKLASGLAHELNNPASAAVRGANWLARLLDESTAAARALAGARLTDEQLASVDGVLAACVHAAPQRSPLEAADREDGMADWLAHNGLDARLSEPLAATEVSVPQLEALATAVPREALGQVIRWVANRVSAQQVSLQIAESTNRINELVVAVKGFSFMDREANPEDVDVGRGIADTIVMLEPKARPRSVSVRLERADDLPRVHGYGAQLNQVWQKLLDNAIDASGDGCAVTVTASRRGNDVVVRIADTGAGIPEHIQPRVFDPFFTTKPVGQGTGLGLDLARRLVHRHRGDIDFTSQPGRTVFRVRLPVTGVAEPRAAAGTRA